MTLGAKETVGRVKMAVEVEQIGAGAPWENALLFWVNRVRPHSPGNILVFQLIPCHHFYTDCSATASHGLFAPSKTRMYGILQYQKLLVNSERLKKLVNKVVIHAHWDPFSDTVVNNTQVF